jgi:choline kinase
MKAVMLLAGMGRRMGETIHNSHKALIELNGQPALKYLIESIINSGLNEFVFVIGHAGEKVKNFILSQFEHRIKAEFVWNDDYMKSNNLNSLLKAENNLLESSFLIVNGDLVIDANIIKLVVENPSDSCIAVDVYRSKEIIDSPKIVARNSRIYDLGRHIEISDSQGYAVGVYKIGSSISKSFFTAAKGLNEIDSNAGFHDPLISMFRDYDIWVCNTLEYNWMDIDEPEDIERANHLINRLYI